MELASGLTRAVEEFSEREAALAKERRTNSFAAKRALDQGREKEEKLLQEVISLLGSYEKRGTISAPNEPAFTFEVVKIMGVKIPIADNINFLFLNVCISF